MSFVVIGVITAGAMVAGTAYSIDQGEQAKRRAGQEKNVAKATADTAERQLNDRKALEKATSERDRMRALQRRRIAGAVGGAMSGAPGIAGPAGGSGSHVGAAMLSMMNSNAKTGA